VWHVVVRSQAFSAEFRCAGRLVAFHSASSRLPLSGAACNSSFDATATSPSLTVAEAPRHNLIPSLQMM
jgi:hypothetical protein